VLSLVQQTKILSLTHTLTEAPKSESSTCKKRCWKRFQSFFSVFILSPAWCGAEKVFRADAVYLLLRGEAGKRSVEKNIIILFGDIEWNRRVTVVALSARLESCFLSSGLQIGFVSAAHPVHACEKKTSKCREVRKPNLAQIEHSDYQQPRSCPPPWMESLME
jgi:hypothetical protein